jgi:hypothetical protein
VHDSFREQESNPPTVNRDRMNDGPQYSWSVVRAYTKETLARRIREKVEAYPPEAIIKIQAGIDFQFFWPFRRNWAVIIVKRPEGPAS